MEKLSITQQYVIDLMKKGWELGVSTSIHGRCRLQRGGLGRGGESINVNPVTIRALRKQGLIVTTGWDFPTEKYILSKEV